MSEIERLAELAAEATERPWTPARLGAKAHLVRPQDAEFGAALANAWPQIRRVLEAAKRAHNGTLPRGELGEALKALEETA